ncbi:MAG TPA: Holliday junction resolvase RuvX, partial [Aeromicrobium sp.]|nr:Holliday junction resolvase RuvX [Aeromicrobium sp.]
MRPGRRLGVDVGDVRIGVATCDPGGMIATPLETVSAGDTAIDRLVELARLNEVIEVIVGLPRSLSGREGPAAVKVRSFATALAARVAPVPVRLVDER